jgi:phosphatidylethanolamine/phosphatidyl-N-methylethanolamine N-methyltransferase
MNHQNPSSAAKGSAPSVSSPIDSDAAGTAQAAPATLFGGLRDRLEFLKGFLGNPNGVASMVPSSHWLEQRVVRAAGLSQARCVIELGPGTGGTTRALLRAMPAQGRLLAIELNPDFHAHVKKVVRDPRLHLELGSAENIGDYLATRRLPLADVVVSGIPFSTMPFDVGDRIARAVADHLAPGGRFVAYQWTPVVAERTTPYLGVPRKQLEVFNLPPMRVFTWTKAST